MPSDQDNQIRKLGNQPVSTQGVIQEKDSQIRISETDPTKLRKTIEEMEEQIRSVESKSEKLRKELVEAKGANCDLQQRLTTLIAELTKERDKGQKVHEQSGMLLNELAKTEALLLHSKTRLERIEVSKGWRFVQRVQALSEHLFPFGTWRREAYRRTINRLARVVVGGRDIGALPNVPLAPRPAIPSYEGASTEATDGHQNPESRPEIVVQIDSPRPGEVCVQHQLIRGWVAAVAGVLCIEILVDGEKAGNAVSWHSGSKGESDHPHYSGDHASGFFYMWTTTLIAEGAHSLTIRAEAKSGARQDLDIPVTVRKWNESPTYDRWISANDPSPKQFQDMAREAEQFMYRPLISVVTPVYRTPAKLLLSVFESVQNQIYTNWELCLADDGSRSPELTEMLMDYSKRDSRIKFNSMPVNQGISSATNAAISLARGEYVAFLDHDDTLAPDALFQVTNLLQNHRDADLIYSDEDKLDLAGNRCDPFFKPDWSPDLLLSSNYICHFLVVRRQLLNEVGGLRSDYDGSQDYDLALRLAERTQKIHHIARILYHWRATETSTALSLSGKSYAHRAAKRAIADYLKRNRIRARVEQGWALGWWQVRYAILENPKVGIVMPTGGRMELLQPCLESLFSHTDYRHYEILLVDNSKGKHVEQYAKSLASRGGGVRYVDYRGKEFNFSAMNNLAVSKITSPFLLLLNDDTAMVNPDWLTAMVEQGQRPSVGAVGAKLLYPGGTIQHAGVLMGIYECTSHAFKNIPDTLPYYFHFPQIIRNCSAVTAACMLTKRSVYLEVGGFDEDNLAVAFQDVDYCLKVCKAGYHIVYTPLAVLIHHESITKEEKIPNMKETRYIQKKWRDVITHDPYYNPNLTRKAEDYSLRLD